MNSNLAHVEPQPNVHALDAASSTMYSGNATTSTQGIIKGVYYTGNDRCDILAETNDKNSKKWLRASDTKICNAATVAFHLGSKVGLETKYSPGGWGWYYVSIWVSDNL